MEKVRLEIPIPESPFVALGLFRKAAKQQGWDDEALRQFMHVAFSADELHLRQLIQEHVEVRRGI